MRSSTRRWQATSQSSSNVLPTRSRLQTWNPESLAAAASSLQSSGATFYDTVRQLHDGIDRMDEAATWRGAAHNASTAMFSRATDRASAFKDYTERVASNLQRGGSSIGSYRTQLLAKSAEIDAGPLNVSDQWVVFIDPAGMSAERAAELEAQAKAAQAELNPLLISLDEADSTTATSLLAVQASESTPARRTSRWSAGIRARFLLIGIHPTGRRCAICSVSTGNIRRTGMSWPTVGPSPGSTAWSEESMGRKSLCHLFLSAALLAAGGCRTDGEPEAAPPHLPQQVLLTESMREQPVPGWAITSAELGLPRTAVVKPVVNIGNHGVFLGIGDGQRWLLGLDAVSGEKTFGPLHLGPSSRVDAIDCVVDGPPLVLCVGQPRDALMPATAWVLDMDAGAVVFNGVTDIRVAGNDGRPRLEHIGDHAVAAVMGKGIYGIGPRGDLTWFVPGNGILSAQFASWNRDAVPSDLGVQNSGSVADVVFSAADGTVVKPAVPQGASLERAMVYPQGFGYEYTAADGQRGVMLFDDFGSMTSDLRQRATLETRSADLPTLANSSGDRVMALDGRVLVELPPTVPDVEARLIGTRLFLANDPDHTTWQQFDLQTGKAGAACETDALGFYYIASDGDVAIALNDDTPARAVDLTTCEELWAMPTSGPDEAVEVWKVGAALIQRTNDRLFSLVSPR